MEWAETVFRSPEIPHAGPLEQQVVAGSHRLIRAKERVERRARRLERIVREELSDEAGNLLAPKRVGRERDLRAELGSEDVGLERAAHEDAGSTGHGRVPSCVMIAAA
jgi:hypothetical protein